MIELVKIIKEDFPYGRAMFAPEAGAALMERVYKTTGDYIEIGSWYGGSAVMAATAMEEANRPGLVVCIDPFGIVNILEGPDKRLQQFWENMLYFGVEQRVLAYRQFHPPYPESLHLHRFSVGLIDGNHNDAGPISDFRALNQRVTDYLLFDNAEQDAVKRTIEIALADADEEEIKHLHNWEEDERIIYSSDHENKEVTLVILKRKEPTHMWKNAVAGGLS